jgi:hypothetical protein
MQGAKLEWISCDPERLRTRRAWNGILEYEVKYFMKVLYGIWKAM